jgi:hypothetical protein
MPLQLPPIPIKVGGERRDNAWTPQKSHVVARRLDALLRNRREEGKMRRILLANSHYTPQEDPDLSLYDDLGVTSAATPEEIRQAHRALARLLHPDRITDEYTRRLAENTLKRMNAAFAILSDPAHRAAYDRELALAARLLSTVTPGARTPLTSILQTWFTKRANTAWLRRNLLWICGTVAGLAIIYLVLGTGSPKGRTVSALRPPAAPQAALQKPVVVKRREPRPTSGHSPRKTAARTGIDTPRAPARHPPLIAPPDIPRAEAELLPPPPDFPALAAAMLPALAKPTLDGLWVYLKPAQTSRSRNNYPPEFIELTLREVNGVLRGRYAARYQVADRPISPEVRFQFEGGATGSTPVTFTWTGNGGSRGEVRLNTIGDQQLQVSWFTTEPGPEMGLSSGSATLIRRQAP